MKNMNTVLNVVYNVGRLNPFYYVSEKIVNTVRKATKERRMKEIEKEIERTLKED